MDQTQLNALLASRLGLDSQDPNTARLSQRRLEQADFQALLEDPALSGLEDMGRELGFESNDEHGEDTLFTDVMNRDMEALSVQALSLLAELHRQNENQGLVEDTAPLDSEVLADVNMNANTPVVLAEGRVEHALSSSIRGTINKGILESPTLDIIAEALVSRPIPGITETSGIDKLALLAMGLEPIRGSLSARFESGADGIAAIGFDSGGGTSYGKYQIASRTGTMRMFLSFLDSREPEWANRLRAAGPADTGSRYGQMPTVWKELAAENPVRFEALQDEFIRDSLYRPALQSVLNSTNVNIGECSPALQEVLWSTSVQHGASGASSIFVQAIRGLDVDSQNFERDLITTVYTMRKQHFQSASSSIRQTVKARLTREMNMALTLLNASIARVI